jgi:hypothetical protein
MKYRLLTPHFSEEDKWLDGGTEVGDGTPHKWTREPTPEMEALDDEAKVALEKVMHKTGGSIDPMNELPMTTGQAVGPAARGQAEPSSDVRRPMQAPAGRPKADDDDEVPTSSPPRHR